ncbi:hypothetical protein KR054_000336 [Drosophila jambulina]|nr:hypothetical protein KR054_000336 [Drosophila jambulina]
MCDDEFDINLSWAVGKKKVLCVGHTTIDCVTKVNEFPRENVHTKAKASVWQRGGNASNTCTVLRNLGVAVEFFGMLSTLRIFQILIDDLKSRGIIVDNCPTCDQPPPFASVILTKSLRTRNLVYCNQGFPFVTIEDFRKLDLKEYGWIHIRALYFDTTMEMFKEIAAYNATRGEDKIIVSIEIDQRLDEFFPLVDYCDYAFFSKQLAQEHEWTSMENAASYLDERLIMRWGLNLKRPFVIVMWGDQGAGMMDIHGTFTHAPPYKPKKMVDLLGVGETFIGSFIYAKYIRERSEKVSVDFANRMASYKITKTGYDHIANILLPPVL